MVYQGDRHSLHSSVDKRQGGMREGGLRWHFCWTAEDRDLRLVGSGAA